METHEWFHSIGYCPSQIYYYFEDPKTNKKYCIYLRWRWCDPWSAELVDQTEDWEFPKRAEGCWERLNVGYYTHDEYPKLESEVIDIISKLFPHIDFRKED